MGDHQRLDKDNEYQVVRRSGIRHIHFSLVVHGTVGETKDSDSYAVAKEMGIYRQIQSPSTLTTDDIVLRILSQVIIPLL